MNQTFEHIPEHVAVIMDGNGRWAKQKGNQRIFGHQNAIKAVRQTVEAAAEIGVKFLTLFAFSTENWNRPKTEVNALMNLLVDALQKELPILKKNNIKLKTIGQTESLPQSCLQNLNQVIEATKENTHMTLNLALSYSGRWDIISGVKKIAQKIKDNKLELNQVDELLFSQHLSTQNIPDPDLMIRTSGELRISNFLLWQLSYAELYFTQTLWPDFSKKEFYKAIEAYQKRERRFGKTSAQIL